MAGTEPSLEMCWTLLTELSLMLSQSSTTVANYDYNGIKVSEKALHNHGKLLHH